LVDRWSPPMESPFCESIGPGVLHAIDGLRATRFISTHVRAPGRALLANPRADSACGFDLCGVFGVVARGRAGIVILVVSRDIIDIVVGPL